MAFDATSAATNMKLAFSLLLLSSLEAFANCEKHMNDPLGEFMKAQRKGWHADYSGATVESEADFSRVYLGSHDGLKEADKIQVLPGQPDGVYFDQYSGYVTVDPKAGRELFYYFAESQNSSSKPLLLWLNGGPGCSSFGYGAMMELGPFRVNSDGKSLSLNRYAWNNVANIIFLESPAGVGFSYSNTSADYDLNGDKHTAEDSYTFLVNWFERFPEYKAREFFIAGESYAGHYVPQLAQKILQFNKITNQTFIINLKGIAIGNAWIDAETGNKGMYDTFWTHALISDEVNKGINSNCNFSFNNSLSDECDSYLDQAHKSLGNINIYDIYAPLCSSYSNTSKCRNHFMLIYTVLTDWKDRSSTVLPVIQELMTNGMSVYIYSGDTDGRVPTTSTRYSINKLADSPMIPWYAWYTQGEVGGYAVGYKNLTFVTIRGAGHFVPSYQPARALALFSAFLDGKLPSPHQN
ncbi:hypothetical protein Pint_34455 [Pistacia integerrima]|uniref:Uncharacterized protein n=1 Tax=Pistacia integerrima TaxID=434235 RepID=A0ACC0X5I3_9ROSI|nr:hypothetical protein Pint_34455 [Pistacia integerrima]